MRFSTTIFLGVLLAILSMASCAKTGRPDGGPKDTIAPVIVKSNPENFTTRFEGDEIKIHFDEYIRTKDLQQQLIISPPLKYQPIITPVNTSKILRIRIQDTLQPETTYSINFGNSIVDNNEQNPYPYYKYVFSTGSYIDSLVVEGKIQDALLRSPKNPATIMLFPWDENSKDSIIYKELPTYIATTRDSTFNFKIENIRAGTYRLVALDESSSNYLYQPETDRIAYLNEPITLPTDSTYLLKLFMQEPEYDLGRPAHLNKRHIVFGYQGAEDTIRIEPITLMPDGFESRIYQDPVKDTLHYWFKPEIDLEVEDSLYFTARYRDRTDTLLVKLKDLYADSLKVSKTGQNTVKPRDTVFFQLNTPLELVDGSKVQIMDQDSIQLESRLEMDRQYNRGRLLFDIEDDHIYTMTLLPGAFTDFYEETNDTLTYAVRSQPISDYGTLSLSLPSDLDYPISVQLVDAQYNIAKSQYLESAAEVYFDYIRPGMYHVRVIFDANGNGRWDAGNFLEGTQPELVRYDRSAIEVRANWSLNETVRLD